MLLFVVAVFVVFHFSLPAGSSDLAAGGLLWVAIIFTALLGLGRAFVPEREQRVLDALVLAPCDRSAIWVAKSLATLTFLVLAELVALPVFALFFHGLDAATIAGDRARRPRHLRGRHLPRRHGGRDPGAGPAAPPPLPAARRSRS